MSRKSTDLSNLGDLFGVNNGQGFNLGNLLNDESTKNFLNDFVSKIGPKLLSGEIVSQVLNKNPNLTDEHLSEQINNFKKSHPESNQIIDKYLGSYQKGSDKNVYEIHRFIKSNDWKKALEDSKVQPYLKEFMDKPEVKKKLQEVITKSTEK